MKRVLTLLAVTALAVSVVLPAAVFAKVDGFAAEESASAVQHHEAVMLTAQSLAVPAFGASAPALRDPFDVEIITPESSYFEPIAGSLAMWPCNANINDGYGDRDGGFHYGVDIMCSWGTPIVASAGGIVEIVEEGGGGWGTYVKIAHGDGISTLYSHMIAGSPVVAVGEIVQAGQVIGSVGQTGYATAPHCHFEVWVGGERVDPRPWLP